MKKNILIVQNYNMNKGDTSVVFAMKDSLLGKYSDIDIQLTSFHPQKAESEYELESSEWLIDYRRIKQAGGRVGKLLAALREFLWLFYSLIWLLLYRLGVGSIGMIPANKKATIRMYLNADVVVLPGGHFFTTLNRLPVVFSHYFALWYAHALNKKTMIYAQTIGPFEGTFSTLCRWMARKAIRFCTAVTVREEDSLRHDIGSKMVLTAESVFLLDRKPKTGVEKIKHYHQPGRKLVGVTIHHIYYAQFYTKDQYIKLMSSVLSEIVDLGCEILFIPMESYRSGDPGDRPMIAAIREAMDREAHSHVVDGDLTSSETEEVISGVDIFVGTKTHSIVYGLKNGIPTIAIAYQEKSNQFMKAFGVLENSINLSDMDREGFMKIFESVLSKGEIYAARQRAAFDEVKENAEKNNLILHSLAEQSREQ